VGKLIDGAWKRDGQFDPEQHKRAFKRSAAAFRHIIGDDPRFPAERGRYHLYVSWACPWAHRTLLFRMFKGLEDIISVTYLDAFMGADGWSFTEDDPDPHNGAKHLYELYAKADPAHSGRVTVPVFWDTVEQTMVSNESAEIIRMFNSAFDDLGAKPGDLYPEELREEIDRINARVYSTVNNGVYKCGFTASQEFYEQAFDELFDSLEWLEGILAERRYLTGDRLTEADWRLFTTLARFDPVYFTHFRCNKKRISDFPNLHGYFRELYQMPGVRETVRVDEIKRHYFTSHETISPRRIIAKGPDLDWDSPHGRDATRAGPTSAHP
jgi:putative glutathione S-transferase